MALVTDELLPVGGVVFQRTLPLLVAFLGDPRAMTRQEDGLVVVRVEDLE